MRRDRGIYRPALALPIPMPGARPVLLLDVGANVTCRPEHLVQFAHMGSAFAQAVMGIELAAGRAALQRRGAGQGHARAGLRSRAARRRAGTGLNFIGNIEGTQVTDGVADVVVMDGFTGNVTLKLIEGVSGRTMRAIRDAAMSSTARQARRLAAGPDRSNACARRSTPRGPVAPTCSGCASSASSPTAASRAAGSARAIEVAARGVQEDVVGRTRAALEGAGALRSSKLEGATGSTPASSEAPATVPSS